MHYFVSYFLRYNGEHNTAVTAEIVKTVANENYSVALVRSKLPIYCVMNLIAISVY